MHWDYLKRWTNFRRQLSKRHITPKSFFFKNKEIMQNSPDTTLVWVFFISLTSSWHSNKACVHCSTQKPIFIFLTSILWALKRTVSLSTLFSLYYVWNAFWQCFSPFELRSYRLRPFSHIKHYNYMLICVFCRAWISYAIKEKRSQLAQ